MFKINARDCAIKVATQRKFVNNVTNSLVKLI